MQPNQIKEATKEISKNGMVEHVYISNETQTIYDRAHRLLIAKEMGLKEVIKYEVNGNSNSIDTIIETLKTGGKTNNSDNVSSPGRESNVENDRLYRQTQGSEPTGNNRTNVRTGEKISGQRTSDSSFSNEKTRKYIINTIRS